MPPRSQLMITKAERRFPVRIKLAHPPNGFGARLTAMYAWLDENCGADGWAFAPAGLRLVVNDATAFYFPDTTLAGAFVARWCEVPKPETVGGAFRLREDEPKPRVPAKDHKSPP